MAASLVESMASDFDPTAFRDEYREAVLAMIENKVDGGTGVIGPPMTTVDVAFCDGALKVGVVSDGAGAASVGAL